MTINDNWYGTDLLTCVEESNILTGEPSREPLDRIRYLRHELNAFSQLQQEQIDVLEQIAHALLSSDQPQDQAHNNPHPRGAVFATLPKGVKIQNDVVQMLSGMLDGLQSEVCRGAESPLNHFSRAQADQDAGSSTNFGSARLA